MQMIFINRADRRSWRQALINYNLNFTLLKKKKQQCECNKNKTKKNKVITSN